MKKRARALVALLAVVASLSFLARPAPTADVGGLIGQAVGKRAAIIGGGLGAIVGGLGGAVAGSALAPGAGTVWLGLTGKEIGGVVGAGLGAI